MYYISVIAFGTLRAAPEEVICINNTPAMQALYAGVAELADAQDLKSCGTYTPIRVRFPLPAY